MLMMKMYNSLFHVFDASNSNIVLSALLLKYVWMERYLVITCIMDSGVEQTVGSFTWRFAKLIARWKVLVVYSCSVQLVYKSVTLFTFDINCRVEGGAIMSEHVFTVKRHAVGHQIISRGKFHLLGYLATRLGKIQVQI